MMVAVIFLMALLVIALAVAVPEIKKSIQRDREEETMARGKQYIRAVQLYYRKFHAYPPSIDALEKTQEIRFLRKKYTDPMTGKDDWKPINFGQNKAPTAMGFFGVPLTGSSIAGIGPSGGNGLPGASPIGQQPGSGFGSGSSFGSNSGSSFGSSPGTGTGIFSNSGAGTNSGTTDGSGSTPGSTNGSGPTSSSTDPNSGTGIGTGGAIGIGPGNGISGQTFGGAGIIGFSPASPKQSILIYKKKDHYNEWEFVYDPVAEQNTGGMSGAGSGAQPINGSTPGFGNGGAPGFGNQPGGIGNNPFQQPGGNPPVANPTPAPPSPPPQQ
jgi:type II secretory pathway pseudopilin PulG